MCLNFKVFHLFRYEILGSGYEIKLIGKCPKYFAIVKVFIRMFAKHIFDSTSFTKTVKFSNEICSKLILIENYTCFRSINEKSHFVFGEIFIIPLVLRTRGIINISPNTRAIFH